MIRLAGKPFAVQPSSLLRPPSTAARPLCIALVGNPNTGKTTLFNALSGLRQRVGNYPGLTVEIKKGRVGVGDRILELVDLPGTYSLAPRSPDEMVAVDLILGRQPGQPRPDAVISIVDASNLKRNLYLTSQILELGLPVVVALNMIDVAQRQGTEIDADRLSRELGVPVVPIQANKGRGLDQLKRAVINAVETPRCRENGAAFPEAFDKETDALRASLGGETPPYLVRRLLLDVGGQTERQFVAQRSALADEISAARQRLAAAGCPVPAVEARTRYAWINQATAGCVRHPERRPPTWTDRIDRVLTHRVWGTLIFLALMFLAFQAIFSWATPLMDALKAGKDLLGEILRARLAAGPLGSLLVDGVLEGVGSVLVFLPQIAILFAFIAVLEDCGYMARAAFLMDKLMSRCGLSGKSFIPMLSSVACAVPGIMATRVIEDRRDRLATILVAPLMSCSARLPVYVLMTGAFLTVGFPRWVPGLTLFGLYLIGLVLAPLMALLFKRTLLRGETPVFVLEMPLYKWPSVRTVARRVVDSSWAFVRRAGTLILAAMVVVWALLYFPRTDGRGGTYDLAVAQHRARVQELEAAHANTEGDDKARLEQDAAQEKELLARLDGEWKRQSYLGRLGRWIEPGVRPLGWDWKIGTAALASFPAREVVVGTLGIIYNMGKVDSDRPQEAEDVSDTPLARRLREERRADRPDEPVFTVPVALSIMVFFALCCQCASTLAVIRRETRSWRWPAFTFAYMTLLAYFGALVVYQLGHRLM